MDRSWSLRLVPIVALASLVTLWLWSVRPDVPPMSHGPRPPGLGTLSWFVVFLVAWMMMTAAMMLPSALPLLRAIDRMAGRRRHLPLVATAAYLAVWGAVGASAWIASAVAEAWLLGAVSANATAWLAGAGLVAAGLYGLSPLANACLRACRRPFGFLARYWRGGRGVGLQAARIGAAYGASCVGCCVPMIGIMFVTGMSDPLVMLLLTGAMIVMKSSSSGPGLARILAIALVVCGAAVATGWLPASTPHAHH